MQQYMRFEDAEGDPVYLNPTQVVQIHSEVDAREGAVRHFAVIHMASGPPVRIAVARDERAEGKAHGEDVIRTPAQVLAERISTLSKSYDQRRATALLGLHVQQLIKGLLQALPQMLQEVAIGRLAGGRGGRA